MTVTKKIKINNKIAIRKVKDTWMVVTLDNTLHRIEDPVGAFIMDKITGSDALITGEDLWEDVSEVFDVSEDPKRYKNFVFLFLDDLTKKDIITFVPDGGRS